jgi:hypothetical protein
MRARGSPDAENKRKQLYARMLTYSMSMECCPHFTLEKVSGYAAYLGRAKRAGGGPLCFLDRVSADRSGASLS